jgi:hypothetical protein
VPQFEINEESTKADGGCGDGDGITEHKHLLNVFNNSCYLATLRVVTEWLNKYFNTCCNAEDRHLFKFSLRAPLHPSGCWSSCQERGSRSGSLQCTAI